MARRSDPAPSPAPAEGRRRGLFRRKPRTGPGRIAQMREVYKMTARVDPSVKWWMLGALLIPFAVFEVIGLITGHWIYFGIIGLLFSVLAALFVLARRAESAAYKSLEGQPGAAGAALRTLRRGWLVEEEPVAIDPRTRDVVFRVVGRPGVILVSDGPAPRVNRLLEDEKRRTARVLRDVPLHTIQCGRGEGQTPLPKLPKKVQRLERKLTKQEVAEVTKRLKALGGVRPPIPKGIDPFRARPDRRAVRGR
ncbi:protein of unknown function [Quadrisphaera granulorum]|uniref:Uncharacterized protein DUF4191 n=1 Tax=Quadrisphaera granulorum TaxID=317664 RepID=A0A315ZS01_9ACTN|nr:DUF4191 domain-containing protein [Quadrisphaera granulorum]PWJ48331.1 uncharacterized protein DUF4191 [Quadrisphaera granulorum]SZE98492.1 protein of unknown function [Quadrisphaera granulorum]